MSATAKDPWSNPSAQMIRTKKKLDEATIELNMDRAQSALDVVGIADPTPISDLLSAGISLSRGNWFEAALSVVSAVPYAGDAIGKTAKAAIVSERMVKTKKTIEALMKKLDDVAKKAKQIAKKKADDLKKAAKNKKCKKCDDARMKNVGRAPSKTSKTGRETIARMRKEGKIKGDGDKMMFKDHNNDWHKVSDADMGHKKDAVTWWNEVGKHSGEKSPKVRDFMLDSKNYELQTPAYNRSQGPKIGETYDTAVMDQY